MNSHICIFRFDGPLIFTSAQKFDKSVRKALKKWDKRCPLESDELGFVWRTQNLSNKTALIIDCSGFPYVDYMGMVTLKRVSSLFTDYNYYFESSNFILQFRSLRLF